MIKKLISFICCLAPLGAGAATIIENPGTGNAYNTPGMNATTDTYVLESGNGIIAGTGGITVANDMYVGLDNPSGTTGGYVYVETGADNPYTIRSDGDISIGSILQVLAGRALGIGSQAIGGQIENATFGSIRADGALTIQDVKNFVSGAISSADKLSITADNITAGAINSTAGDTTLSATGALEMGQLIADGNATTVVNAGTIQSGDIQNISGTMNITSGGALTGTGSVQNNGAAMTITAGDMTVAGTMSNTDQNGVMNVNASSLTVNGGDSNNPSLTNTGTMTINVSGQTSFAGDLYVSGQGAATSLTTGTLVLGGDRDILNDSNAFELTVSNGPLTAGKIANGVISPDANMKLTAQSVSASSVVNNAGNLSIKTIAGSGGAINIAGVVDGAAASNTEIVADGVLTVGGNVSNSGTMTLNGGQVELANVSNNGQTLNILALTDATGKITIGGDLTNASGTTLVNSREIDITGVITNNGGTTEIRGSDSNGGSVKIGAIDVAGGHVDINALAGGVDVSNALNVSGGSLNVGAETYSFTAGSVNIAGNFTLGATPATGAGDVNVAASGVHDFTLTSNSGVMTIEGNISALAADYSRRATFGATTITVGTANGGGNITAQNKGYLAFGGANSTKLTAFGTISATDGGVVEFFTDSVEATGLTNIEQNGAAGKFIAHGTNITATTDAINIAGGVWFDGTNPNSGMVVADTSRLTLKTAANSQNINIAGGASIGAGKTLALDSAGNATVGGLVNVAGALDVDASGAAVFDNMITSTGRTDVSAASINTADVSSTGTASFIANGGDIRMGNVSNSGAMTLAGDAVASGAMESTGGVLFITATDAVNGITAAMVDITGGQANLNSAAINVAGRLRTTGDLYNGTARAGMLNIERNSDVSANSLVVGGNFVADAGSSVDYTIAGGANITGKIDVKSGATSSINAASLTSGDVDNSGALSLIARDSMTLGAVENNAQLTLNSGSTIAELTTFINNATGSATLSGAGMKASTGGKFITTGTLHQNYADALVAGDVNVAASNYAITASNIDVASISQQSGRMVLNTGDIDVGGSIIAQNLRIAANPAGNWLNADIAGNVSGGVQFIGLEHMSIGGNYTFTDNSIIHAAILPYAAGGGNDTTTYNYWATVSLKDDNTLGQITNGANAQPLISVGKKFISEVATLNPGANGGALHDGQIGIDVFSIVDPGQAIWLVHADEGLTDLATKIRNLNVNFCNADASLCFNYFDSVKLGNDSGTADGTPAYISVRDTNDDGDPDSLYIVFDPRFGGPVEVFKIQPIVGREVYHTTGEYVSAGALDNMIAGRLHDAKFYNRTPIEAIPQVFRGTNMETLAQELYNRMEQYNLDRNGAGLSRFSRLMQAREIEQVAGALALNEHTSFRAFEDHMFDEFIWNRHRSLKKAWADVDFGMFSQGVSDDKNADGNRFSITGGYDWQDSPTLILGVAGRVSHMSSENSDEMDLGYLPGQSIAGRVHMDVSDTNIGVGGYLMKTLGLKTRAYGNAFLDLHIFDVSREQNYVGAIDGTGTAFSLISEWGMMYDWLNQYVVGNLYARIGYNFGFSVKEKVGGEEYMRMKSDGYMVLTPGYSLIAQKRIYPSAWFQIRPYASIGVEYDVLGAPDNAKYKFASAKSYTNYDIEIDPMWANIGGGVELISATGIQVGLDYRYQYNTDIQLHNIRVSGSYRF